MNRIDRISAILIQLQSKKIVRAADIAERFNISLRTVYRDIKALEEAGVPIGAEAGRGYYIVEGYHLPPVMFSSEEAGSILIAEKLVDKFTDNLTQQHFTSAALKIKSILPMIDKEYLEKIDNQIQILYSPYNEGQPNHFIPDIQKAIARRKIISLDYKSLYKGELTEKRKVEPLWLFFYGFSWHLIGWCRLRGDYRDFRADRIVDLQLTDENYEPRNNSPLQEFLKILWKENELLEVSISVSKKTAQQLQTSKYYFGFVEQDEKGTEVIMRFAVNNYKDFGKWLLTLGNKIRIVKPDEMHSVMQKLVDELCDYYKK